MGRRTRGFIRVDSPIYSVSEVHEICRPEVDYLLIVLTNKNPDQVGL